MLRSHRETIVKLTARLLLACALLFAALAPRGLAAQQLPITLEVSAGYDGAGQYRLGHWFPVRVVAANEGGDVSGTLEFRFPGDNGARFRYNLDLPRGARKQVLLNVTSAESFRNAELVLLANGAEVANQLVRLEPINVDQFAIGVLSTDRTLLNSLGALRPNNTLTTVVSHLDPATLPEDAALLAGLDVIFVHDIATADLSDGQRAALALWTRLGGQLVVGGGSAAEQVVPGLAELLPVEVGALRADAPSATLEQLARRNDLGDSLPTLTASEVTPRPGATSLDGANLLLEAEQGAGRVIFAAFELDALRSWAGESDLWARVLRVEERVQVGYSFRWRSENLLREALQLPALQVPSTALLLLLIVVYIVVIGPLNFLLLRRLRRVELAWVTTPLLVLLFLAGAYGASFVLRGTQPQISQLSVVQAFEGQPQGQTTAFVGVFSPQRRSYRLNFLPNTLVTPGTFEGFQFRSVPVTSDDVTTAVDDLLIDVSSLRSLILEGASTAVPELQSSLQRSDNAITGQLRNLSGAQLSDALLVFRNSAQQLGDLTPGATVEVEVDLGPQNFPDQIDYPEDGLFSQERVLYNLFGYDRFAPGGPTFQGDKGLPDQGVYLLAWSDAPALDVTIDGNTSRQQGQTLYVIRLDV